MRRGEQCGDCDATAAAIVSEFLGNVPNLRATLATDVQAAFDGDPAAKNTDEIIFSYPGLLAITIFRLAHELWKAQVPLIPRIMTEYAHDLTGIDIHPGATIDGFFFIDHGTGVVIGETCIIGKHVKIYQGVTLGALSTRGGQGLRGQKRHPTLEDEVTVYAGATILGGDTAIGKGATISGNVFLTQSVPAGSRVSAKNPELTIKNRPPAEFKQELPQDWQI
jgi:serine O-acetyltransferase